jgi:hypothetical protein
MEACFGQTPTASTGRSDGGAHPGRDQDFDQVGDAVQITARPISDPTEPVVQMISAARVAMSSSRTVSEDFSDAAAAVGAAANAISVTWGAILRLDGRLSSGDCMRQPTRGG